MKPYSLFTLFLSVCIISCSSCGKKKQAFGPPSPKGQKGTHIVGGEKAEPKDAPWQVAIIDKKNYGVSKAGLRCGGSIIDKYWILTACHCFYDTVEGEIVKDSYKDFVVYYGSIDLKNIPLSKAVTIDTIIDGRGYDFYNQNNDIALLKLSTPISFANPSPQKIRLPIGLKLDEHIARKDTAMVTGWGTLSASEGSYPDILQKIWVPLVNHDYCKEIYANIEPVDTYQVLDSMLCAGYDDGGKDSCGGDSGGPMALKIGNISYLIGVVSWGLSCAEPYQYGVYTDVTKYVDWIREKTNVNF